MKATAYVELLVECSEGGHGIAVDFTERIPLNLRVEVELPDEWKKVIISAIKKNTEYKSGPGYSRHKNVRTVALSLGTLIFEEKKKTSPANTRH